jgi:hypothetical protein
MQKEVNKIILDDLSIGLYRIHLDRKNHRICRVMRTLMLRRDFVDFLEKLENEALHQEELKRNDGQMVKLWTVNHLVSGKLIRDYLHEVVKSAYIQKQSNEWVDYFLEIAETLIEQTYLDGYANARNKNSIFSNMVIFDDALNYPNIRQSVYDKEIFWKIFNDAFYSDFEKIKEKYGKHPRSIVIGGNKFDDIPNKENLTPTDPKVCQIVFDDTTEKQELIDYIDKNWGSIEERLKSWRPSREEKRITSSANFVRDTDIYNRYQEFKKDGYKNPDVKVYSWLANDAEEKVVIEPNTVRKIVSLLKTEIDEINK